MLSTEVSDAMSPLISSRLELTDRLCTTDCEDRGEISTVVLAPKDFVEAEVCRDILSNEIETEPPSVLSDRTVCDDRGSMFTGALADTGLPETTVVVETSTVDTVTETPSVLLETLVLDVRLDTPKDRFEDTDLSETEVRVPKS